VTLCDTGFYYDIVVNNGRRSIVSGVVGRKVVKRSCFPELPTMATTNHSLPPLNAHVPVTKSRTRIEMPFWDVGETFELSINRK
jgi:hypothetical protein